MSIDTQPTAEGFVRHREAVRPDVAGVRYPGFRQECTVLRAGSHCRDDGRALSCDIVFDRDVAVQLRDGTTIYTDLYRPVDATDLPTVVAWSPYGKRDGAIALDDFPFRAGVPLSVVSGLEKFEGPDPAYWCAHGYAVANPDARGAFASEGDIRMWNRREGEDGADVVEWLGGQDWSNGKVGLAGTSWLAIAQWFIAAEHPRHLAAIAPWEGLSDVYRNAVAPGGMVDPGFVDWLISIAVGNRYIEDLTAMIHDNPTADSWTDYIADVGSIDVPAYVVASWANVLHSRGTFEAWRSLRQQEKWLRVHASLEWPDFYQPHNQDDLRRFFDHYLLGRDTGWESTPPVRLDIVDPGGDSIPNQAEDTFPPTRARPWTLHLSPDETLADVTPNAGLLEYDAEGPGVVFTHVFDQDVELVGYPRLILHLEADGSDDIDVFAKLAKVDTDGQPLGTQLLPLQWRENAAVSEQIAEISLGHLRPLYYYDGPWARLRASHREKDESRSTLVPHHTHLREDKLTPGEIVEVELGFTAIGMRFHAGETLRLTVTGTNTAVWAAPNISQPDLRNRGRHRLHIGAGRPSRLVLPLTRARQL